MRFWSIGILLVLIATVLAFYIAWVRFKHFYVYSYPEQRLAFQGTYKSWNDLVFDTLWASPVGTALDGHCSLVVRVDGVSYRVRDLTRSQMKSFGAEELPSPCTGATLKSMVLSGVSTNGCRLHMMADFDDERIRSAYFSVGRCDPGIPDDGDKAKAIVFSIDDRQFSLPIEVDNLRVLLGNPSSRETRPIFP